MTSTITRKSVGNLEDAARHRRSVSYRMNGYADLGGSRSHRHQNEANVFHQAEALLRIHQVLNNASGLPIIRTAPPPRSHLYNWAGTRKHLTAPTTGREGLAGLKYKAPILVKPSAFAKRTLKQLTFSKDVASDTTRLSTASRSSSRNEKAVTSPWTLPISGATPSDSNSECRRLATATKRGSPMWSMVSEYSTKGGRHDALLPPHLDTDRSVVKCRAWLQSCAPWWRINDEYPVELTTH